MIFIDGLGLGDRDPARNPIHRGDCTHLQELIEEARPIDACLGVPGVPQSATGQTALFTGHNAPRLLGRHIEGFPGARLRALIREENIFRSLIARGCSATFANAYYLDGLTEKQIRRRRSVTTIATLQAFGRVREKDCMLARRAVYQDLTRQALRVRGYDGPLVTPAESARHLMRIAADYDFTLFEYFQTDHAGHKNNPAKTKRVLCDLDQFIEALMPWSAQPGQFLLVSSDHGNIEDCRTCRHTRNPVPFILRGEPPIPSTESVDALTDVAPWLLRTLQPKACERA